MSTASRTGDSYGLLYQVYRNMLKRCYNPKWPGFNLYGGRGIKVCGRWLESFKNFKIDMEESYLEHKKNNKYTYIDRKDNDKGYSVENCKWSTAKEQIQNRRNMKEFKAVRLSDGYEEIASDMQAFATKHGLTRSNINRVILGRGKTHKGWTFTRQEG